jgi:hypothetical protein
MFDASGINDIYGLFAGPPGANSTTWSNPIARMTMP